MVGEHKRVEKRSSLAGLICSFLFCCVCLVGLGVSKLMTGPYRLCIPQVHEVAVDWTDVTDSNPLRNPGRVRVRAQTSSSYGALLHSNP